MFISQPTNVDFLIDAVRFRLGDFAGTLYTTTLIRTAIIGGIRYLMPRWSSKYLIYSDLTKIVPQPGDIAAGYIQVATPYGLATILDDRGDGTPYIENDVFRNPYVTFLQDTGLFEQNDEEAIVLSAVIAVHIAKFTSNADSFVSFKTEDLSYSNLGGERARQGILTILMRDLDALFKTRIAAPKLQTFYGQDPYGLHKVY